MPYLRIPVAVINDDGVRRSQIDTLSPGFCAQEKSECVSTSAVEAVNSCLSIVTTDGAIDAFVSIPARQQQVLQQRQEHLELRENEYAVACVALADMRCPRGM